MGGLGTPCTLVSVVLLVAGQVVGSTVAATTGVSSFACWVSEATTLAASG